MKDVGPFITYTDLAHRYVSTLRPPSPSNHHLSYPASSGPLQSVLEAAATSRSLVDLLHFKPTYLPQSPTTGSTVHPTQPSTSQGCNLPLLCFPSSSTGCGFDAIFVLSSFMPLGIAVGTEHGDRNTECNYLSACVSIYTDSNFTGHGVCVPRFLSEFHTHTMIQQVTFSFSAKDRTGKDIITNVVDNTLGTCTPSRRRGPYGGGRRHNSSPSGDMHKSDLRSDYSTRKNQ